MGKSSKDKRDAYYRLAKEQGWRARSAFKLLQLDEEFNLFDGVKRVVDLCAAPGSWSQVLSRVLIQGERVGRVGWEQLGDESKGKATAAQALVQDGPSQLHRSCPDSSDVRIVAIDLQPMAPLPGIVTLRADITHPSTIPLLLAALDPERDPTVPHSASAADNPVDLVISDGAPDVSGLHDLDIYVQSQLLWAALNLALGILRPGGAFVAKIFRAKDVDLLYSQLKVAFRRVTVAKPRASRASSLEAFIVCQDFCPPPDFVARLEDTIGSGIGVAAHDTSHSTTMASRVLKADGSTEFRPEVRDEKHPIRLSSWIAPFLACGDLTAYDADASYHLPPGHVSLDPVQPPTAPPYKRALAMRRALGGDLGQLN